MLVTLLFITHRMIIASFSNSLHFQIATRVLQCTLSEKISFHNVLLLVMASKICKPTVIDAII